MKSAVKRETNCRKKELDVLNPDINSVEGLSEAFETFNKSAQKMKLMYSILEKRVAYLTNELDKKSKELEKANRLAALGELAAGVAHEIRNPLGGIELCATMLEREFRYDKSKKETIMPILEGTRRLNNIVVNLLQFARENKVAWGEVDVEKLLDESIKSVKISLEKNNVAIVKSFAAGAYFVRGDADQLRQVCINIMLNAIEAMPSGGNMTLEITPHLEPESEKRVLAISFSDTGPGIDQENLTKIFQPFFTTKDDGTGLGLAISYKIIERHHGKIVVESKKDKGARFTIFLPLELSNGNDS